jgi:hypothetical protein
MLGTCLVPKWSGFWAMAQNPNKISEIQTKKGSVTQTCLVFEWCAAHFSVQFSDVSGFRVFGFRTCTLLGWDLPSSTITLQISATDLTDQLFPGNANGHGHDHGHAHDHGHSHEEVNPAFKYSRYEQDQFCDSCPTYRLPNIYPKSAQHIDCPTYRLPNICSTYRLPHI